MMYLRPVCEVYDVSPAAGDPRALRKMITDRKMAHFYRGDDDEDPDKEECPICMLVRRSRVIS